VVDKLEADGLALTHARWSLVGSDGGERVELAGRGTIVSRRQPDGSWRIVLDHPLSPC
jgi:ketosteroid isomerase-like protein